jgi:UDP-N-acetylglucosamine 2-epimerase (non-hydrolysing)
MTARNILVVFGTRPEAIKLFPVVHALSVKSNMRILTCVTAQHRGLLDQVLKIAKVTPDYDLDIMTPGQNLDTLTTRLLSGVGEVLDANSVDCVIVQGDTSTAMTAALAAYYRKLPVAHVEAGLRSGNIYHPWPEEVNRRMIAPIARWHFAPTAAAGEALRRESITENVHVVGNTVIDALHSTLEAINKSPVLAAGSDAVLEKVGGRRMVLVTTHRRENFGEGMERIAKAIVDIAAREDVAVVFPVHPNPGVRSVMDRVLSQRSNVIMTDPLDYPSFVKVLSMAHVVLTDSGGVQEEAPALGKPVLVMRETTERPEGVHAGTAKLVGTDTNAIVAGVAKLLDDPEEYGAMARAHNPFGDGESAGRIADLLEVGLSQQ